MGRSTRLFALPIALIYCLLPLLIATGPVLKSSIRRCGVDTACFINNCLGHNPNENLGMYKYTRELDPKHCQIFLQIKKLSSERYVIFGRFHTDENTYCQITTDQNTYYLTDPNADMIRYTAKFSYLSFDVRFEVKAEDEEFKLLSVSCPASDTKHSVNAYFEKNEITQGKMAVKAIRDSQTCSSDVFLELKEAPDGYEIEPVDFFNRNLTCSDSFTLFAASENGDFKPLALPQVDCVDGVWQTKWINDDELFTDFYKSVGHFSELPKDRHKKHTITDNVLLGCARRGCAQCLALPTVSGCESCMPAKLANNGEFECAELTCGEYEKHGFTVDGETIEEVAPICHYEIGKPAVWYRDGTTDVIKQLSCIDGAKKRRRGDEHTDFSPEGSALKTHETRKKGNKTSKVEEDTRKNENAASWLKKNWIGSILTPLIIVAVIGGCIVFLVFVLRTKDEQEQLVREERRRERERREENYDSLERLHRSANSRSAEALV